jgi:hypothetical protein
MQGISQAEGDKSRVETIEKNEFNICLHKYLYIAFIHEDILKSD